MQACEYLRLNRSPSLCLWTALIVQNSLKIWEHELQPSYRFLPCLTLEYRQIHIPNLLQPPIVTARLIEYVGFHDVERHDEATEIWTALDERADALKSYIRVFVSQIDTEDECAKLWPCGCDLSQRGVVHVDKQSPYEHQNLKLTLFELVIVLNLDLMLLLVSLLLLEDLQDLIIQKKIVLIQYQFILNYIKILKIIFLNCRIKVKNKWFTIIRSSLSNLNRILTSFL